MAGLLDELARLVAVESPSADPAATAACAEVVADLGVRSTGAQPERLVVAGRTHLRWRFGNGAPRVVLLGHLDTVWPAGTLARWPLTVRDGRATGPGVVDMKAGLVQLFSALSTLDSLDGLAVVITSDEEIGSVSSRELVEQTAAGAVAALVLEPSAAGALKTARKGTASFVLRVTGRASHAGLAPDQGINAGVELAHQILAIAALGDAGRGTTVTPTVASIGTTSNTVPAGAELRVDVRAFEPAELDRVAAAMRALRPVLPGAQLTVEAGPSRPPMPASASADLFALAGNLAGELGLGPLRGEPVGGGSDGNLTAGIGVPTLDGLGAVGGNPHAEGEWVDLAAMPQRAALVAALVRDLLAMPAAAA
jgi:glutamate carboxypeptidase